MSISRIISLPSKLAVSDNAATRNNLIAVASGKGGVGKTWLSVSLAHLFAKAGQRVLLFDGDLGLANVDIQLGLITPYDLGAVIAGKIPLTHAIAPCKAGGFDVIAGRSGSGSLASMPVSRLQMMFDDLRLVAQQYDKVIIDLGAGVERAVRLFAENAGKLLVVCSDEPTSLTDAYAFIKIIVKENPKIDIRVVVNAVLSVREGERTFATLQKACKGFLNYTPSLAGIIRKDARVRGAIRSQTSIITTYPDADAVSDVLKIAQTL